MHYLAGLVAVSLCVVSSVPAQAQTARKETREQEIAEEKAKSAEDPTKIATKVGVAYSDELSVSGSVAIGPKFKFNGRVSESGQWSLGASYLFPVAILTLTAGRNKLDSGIVQTRYSVGGFVPLSQIGVKTGRLQIFVPFGYSHMNGKGTTTDVDQNDNIPVELNSNSAYVGVFMLRPLNEKFTLMGGGNVTKGTNDFSGFSVAGGVSYHLTRKDTVGVSASYINNSFGQKEKLSISLRHEF